MACHLKPSVRDLLVRLFRADVYRRCGFVEFPPQADFRLATEGYTLTHEPIEPPDEEPLPFDPAKIQPEDYATVSKPVRVLVPCEEGDKAAFQVGETENFARYEWRLAEPRQAIIRSRRQPERLESGVVAHKASMLASFKNGKSKEIGLWAAGFACLPGATIDMLGLEYGTSEHEFNYLIEALLSGKDAPVKKYKHLYNDVNNGRMLLELHNGCSYQVRSWKNKDRLRGGQITVYIFNEIYQLPGFEVYTGHAQNLRAENGFAAFTSTPDRPWVKVLHKRGHGVHPDWHCTCDNNAYVNPFTFNLNGLIDDLPDWDTLALHAPALVTMAQESGLQPGALMSREKFLISWLGKIGGFVGRVYNFDKESMTCLPSTHPTLFKPSVVQAWKDRQDYLRQLSA